MPPIKLHAPASIITAATDNQSEGGIVEVTIQEKLNKHTKQDQISLDIDKLFIILFLSREEVMR